MRIYLSIRIDLDCDGLADVIFILDSSESVGEVNFGKMKSYVENIVDMLDIGDTSIRVSNVYYNRTYN